MIFITMLLIRKLEQAENMIKSGNYHKGIALFDTLCTSKTFRPNERVQSLERFYELSSLIKQDTKHNENTPQNDAIDTVIKLRDSLLFLKGEELDDCKQVLSIISKSNIFSSHEKLMCIVSLYNTCALEVCYPCFSAFASNINNNIKHRIDATHYMYGSGDYIWVEKAKNIILAIIQDKTHTSEFRYNTIHQFISKSGIATLTNFSKIRVPYSEEFVFSLQTTFFEDDENNISELILSGQHLLTMLITTDEQRQAILETLLKMASNTTFSENSRASAADVVVRLGNKIMMQKAKELIVSMGYSAISGVGVGRTQTIFNNSQNAHSFIQQAETIVEKIVDECNNNGFEANFEYTRGGIIQIMKLHDFSDDEKFRVSKVLHRIYLDGATFTKYNLTLSDVICCLWEKVSLLCQQYPEIDIRVIDELLDMNDTCSSGHFTRLINVLSEFDSNFVIQYAEQITANAVARMNTRIRDCEDEDLRCKLAIAQSELADDDDIFAYNQFLEKNMVTLKKELFDEFVRAGYVSSEYFEDAFNKAVTTWEI